MSDDPTSEEAVVKDDHGRAIAPVGARGVPAAGAGTVVAASDVGENRVGGTAGSGDLPTMPATSLRDALVNAGAAASTDAAAVEPASPRRPLTLAERTGSAVRSRRATRAAGMRRFRAQAMPDADTAASNRASVVPVGTTRPEVDTTASNQPHAAAGASAWPDADTAALTLAGVAATSPSDAGSAKKKLRPSSSHMFAATRQVARKLALQALYRWQLNDGPWQDLVQEFGEAEDMANADREYFRALVEGVSGSRDALDARLGELIDRPVGQLDPVEHAVLLIGLYELTARLEVPYRVAINEAVGLAKRFGATDGHKFVNAVLDRAARTLRPDEK